MWIELRSDTFLVSQATKKGFLECEYGSAIDISYPTSDTRRGRVQGGGGICPTLTSGQNIVVIQKLFVE